MTPRPAQYLVRFDDLCPTHSRSRWEPFSTLVEEFGIRPILAVIPDNQDRELMLSGPDPDFWNRMRTMEAAGATIALHGYQHLCDSRGCSMLPIRRYSEFAGVPEEIQRRWIHEGLKSLRCHGLSPCLWVAPRHGFDRATLRVLREAGIGFFSDGLTSAPITRNGITWIPQQLWGPVNMTSGLWTICIHGNSASSALVKELRAVLQTHAAQFTSFDRVLEEYEPAEFGFAERLYEAAALWRLRFRCLRKWHVDRRRMI